MNHVAHASKPEYPQNYWKLKNTIARTLNTWGVIRLNQPAKKDDDVIEAEITDVVETEPKPVKKPWQPSRAMLKSIQMKLELKRYTKEQICEACRISRQTLWRWERDPNYVNFYLERSREVLREFEPTVNKALQIAIIKGDTQAIKLYYQLIERVKEIGNVTFQFGDVTVSAPGGENNGND